MLEQVNGAMQMKPALASADAQDPCGGRPAGDAGSSVMPSGIGLLPRWPFASRSIYKLGRGDLRSASPEERRAGEIGSVVSDARLSLGALS
jgi:hypothetical protein